MNTFMIIVALATALYALAMLAFAFGLYRLRPRRAAAGAELFSVSVIIPARNEAEVLTRTIESLMEQDYSGEWEVIVVDDRSTDETPTVLNDLQKAYARLRVVTVKEPYPKSPKKNALALGIRQSNRDLIITTDADCVYHPGWIRSLVDNFSPATGVVAGLTVFALPESVPVPFWQKLQWLDFFVQNFLAAAAVGLGLPSSCNGSNLAYRRQVYQEIEGFGKNGRIVSGDDVLFAQRVSALTSWKMEFAVDPDSTVRSLPVHSLAELVQQRLRWASKGLSYRGLMLGFLFAIYLYYLALAAVVIVPFLRPELTPLSLAIFAVKLSADFSVIAYACARFQQMRLLPFFLPFSLAHTLLTPLVGFGGLLVPFRWKGDWYRTSRLPHSFRRRIAVMRRRFSPQKSTAAQRVR